MVINMTARCAFQLTFNHILYVTILGIYGIINAEKFLIKKKKTFLLQKKLFGSQNLPQTVHENSILTDLYKKILLNFHKIVILLNRYTLAKVNVITIIFDDG